MWARHTGLGCSRPPCEGGPLLFPSREAQRKPVHGRRSHSSAAALPGTLPGPPGSNAPAPTHAPPGRPPLPRVRATQEAEEAGPAPRPPGSSPLALDPSPVAGSSAVRPEWPQLQPQRCPPAGPWQELPRGQRPHLRELCTACSLWDPPPACAPRCRAALGSLGGLLPPPLTTAVPGPPGRDSRTHLSNKSPSRGQVRNPEGSTNACGLLARGGRCPVRGADRSSSPTPPWMRGAGGVPQNPAGQNTPD